MHQAIVIGVLLLACGAWPAAAAEQGLTRKQALAQLGSTDVKQRRVAAERLGEVGVMGDVRALLRALRDRDEATRELAEGAIWQVWSRSGDEGVDRLFERGVLEMNIGALDAAIDTFSVIIERKPDFAEGWNKRATAYFLAGELEKSLKDCDEVLRRNPLHFGVLAGYGQIYAGMNQPERALEYFQRALKLNPNMGSVAEAIEDLKRIVGERRGRMI